MRSGIKKFKGKSSKGKQWTVTEHETNDETGPKALPEKCAGGKVSAHEGRSCCLCCMPSHAFDDACANAGARKTSCSHPNRGAGEKKRRTECEDRSSSAGTSQTGTATLTRAAGSNDRRGESGTSHGC